MKRREGAGCHRTNESTKANAGVSCPTHISPQSVDRLQATLAHPRLKCRSCAKHARKATRIKQRPRASWHRPAARELERGDAPRNCASPAARTTHATCGSASNYCWRATDRPPRLSSKPAQPLQLDDLALVQANYTRAVWRVPSKEKTD